MTTPIRVPILERLVPSLAFIVAAISGAIGALMTVRFFAALRQSENAGYAAFFGGLSEIEIVVGAVLTFAAVLCAIGIIVSIIRLFTTNTKSSPPGLLFLIAGLLSIAPPFAIHYVLHMVKGVLISPVPGSGGVSGVAGTVAIVANVAIGAAGLIAIILIAFTFIPFSSRAGRKASPLICLILVEIIIVALAGIYFWEARTSMVECDKERDFYPTSSESPSTTDSDFDTNSNETPNAYRAPVGTNSKPGGKTISGGVLNGKAIELPQPVYPPTARAVRATGAVSVQVLVDETGDVVSATAVSGHALLRAAAVQAARKAKFKPTLLSGQPVTVSGVLTYNFSDQ